MRSLQVGLRLEDLDYLTHGQVTDIMIEADNDNEEYAYIATQEDFDKF